jgi:hypothetical protein
MVMPGLVPGIHDLCKTVFKGVDGQNKLGYDAALPDIPIVIVPDKLRKTHGYSTHCCRG